MQKNLFSFLGRRIELWTHPEPDLLATIIRSTERFYEPDVLLKAREVYLPGTVIVDIGANVGNHTVFFAAILGAPVVAFEPYEANFDLLEANVAANSLEGKVRAHRVALGNRNGSGSARLADPGNFGTVQIGAQAGSIPIRTLDRMLRDHPVGPPVGLIKIDVEGNEVPVLEGAQLTIERWLPDILVEADGTERFLAVVQALHDHGYMPRGRFAWTPTYLFSAIDQPARIRAMLERMLCATESIIA